LAKHGGDAMTTQAARKTPFHLLVVMSSSGPSSGELFLDDGVEVEMGAEGGKWTLVKFSAGVGEKSMTITSSVVNGEFASSQNWIIEKITILGLAIAVKMHEFIVETSAGTRNGDVYNIRSRNDEKGGFVVTEISTLKLPIGQNFKIDLHFQGGMKYQNPTK